MKTICIKTNNKNVIDYLLSQLKNLKLQDVYFSCKKFKVFKNIIIHYKGSNLKLFLYNITEILSSLIFNFYEIDIAKRIISNDYFYFNIIEQNEILLKFQYLCNNDINTFSSKKANLINSFYKILENTNKIYLKGIVTFRLSDYIKELQNQIDSAVSQYLIEKEYNEFVSLLKLYISTEPSQVNFVHLIYKNGSPILLDENKKIIETDSNFLNAKYLSDITFSSSDIALNTLLNIIPQKIYIHLIDEKIDEFITTLELIFEHRIVMCTDCNICRIYKSQKANS